MSILCVVERDSVASMEVASWLAERLALPLFPVHATETSAPLGLAAMAKRVGASLLVLPVPKDPCAAWHAELTVLLGSAQLPVLLVRESAPFAGWANGTRPLCTVMDFDFTPMAERVVQWLERLTRVGPVELVAVHEYESTRAVVNAASSQTYARAQFARASIERELYGRLGPLQGDLALRVRVEPMHGATLADHAVEELADLIAVAVDVHDAAASAQEAEALRITLAGCACCVLCLPTSGPKLVG